MFDLTAVQIHRRVVLDRGEQRLKEWESKRGGKGGGNRGSRVLVGKVHAFSRIRGWGWLWDCQNFEPSIANQRRKSRNMSIYRFGYSFVCVSTGCPKTGAQTWNSGPIDRAISKNKTKSYILLFASRESNIQYFVFYKNRVSNDEKEILLKKRQVNCVWNVQILRVEKESGKA